MGKFHGESYALKHKNPDLFNSIVHKFKESRYKYDIEGQFWDFQLRTGPKRAALAVRNSSLKDEIPESFLQKFESALENPHAYQKEKVIPIEPFATICHGDFLRNNIAFKYTVI